ncbi:hypothetical protein [Wolbachia endosymbiont of Armadillidium arcangelii]|uniref:Uncharacterized protein n=1 Tax=Wolbachia endosymbiont of Armadillidium arcangelii TaxID=3158571 RepID=A0AAU7Q3F8_9RICK
MNKEKIESPDLICTRQCRSPSKKACENKCQDYCIKYELEKAERDLDNLKDPDNLSEKDRQDLDKYLKCLEDNNDNFEYYLTLFEGQSSSDYLF